MSGRSMSGSDWAMLMLLSLVWGGSFFFNEVALRQIPPLTLVLFRVGLGAILLHLLVRAFRIRVAVTARLVLDFLVLGLFANALPFALIVWGQTAIEGGLASIIGGTTTLWTVCIAHFIGDRLTATKLGGVILGLLGVVVLIGPGALGSVGTSLPAQLAVIGAAVCYAIAAIFAKARVGGIPPFAAAAHQLTAATVLLLPFALFIDRPWTLPAPEPGTLAAVAGLVILSTGLAYVLFFRLLASAGTNVVLVALLVPVSAILLGALFLDERLEPQAFAGMILISLGLAAIDGRMVTALRRLARPKERQDPGLSIPDASGENRV